MAGLADILHRFRAVGVAGAPRPAGPPVDRLTLARAELAPVFAAIEPFARQAAEVEDRAAVAARRIRDEAAATASGIRAAAAGEADGARSRAAAERLRQIEIEIASVRRSGRAEAARIGADAAAREAELVERIVTRALALMGSAARPEDGTPN